MFLNEIKYFETPVLIDQDVNYYGFLESKEYKDIEDYVMQYDPLGAYNSPYFGLGGEGYRKMDQVYEAYRQRVKSSLSTEKDPTRVVKTGTTGGVNTALILAAAAAAFFIGG